MDWFLYHWDLPHERVKSLQLPMLFSYCEAILHKQVRQRHERVNGLQNLI